MSAEKNGADWDAISKWPVTEIADALTVVIMHRHLDELALVGILSRVRKDKTVVPKSLILEDLDYTVNSERRLIGLLGRRRAGMLYGKIEGVSSAVKSVDHALNFDFHGYYVDLIAKEKEQPQGHGQPQGEHKP